MKSSLNSVYLQRNCVLEAASLNCSLWWISWIDPSHPWPTWFPLNGCVSTSNKDFLFTFSKWSGEELKLKPSCPQTFPLWPAFTANDHSPPKMEMIVFLRFKLKKKKKRHQFLCVLVIIRRFSFKPILCASHYNISFKPHNSSMKLMMLGIMG